MATTEQKFLDYPGLEYYHQQNIATMDEKDVSVLDNSKSYTDSSVQAKGNELGTRIDNLILNAGDSSAECADARVTKDGTVHDTLKNRLDTEYSQLSEDIADLKENGTGGTGLTSTEKGLMLTLFKNMLSQNNMSDTVNALEKIWTDGNTEPDKPDEPDEPVTYTIKYNLTNVISSNSEETIVGGNTFTTTLEAEENYKLGNVTVIMGGIDVTDSVYVDGVITISNVSGNIVVNATASEMSGCTNWEVGVPYEYTVINNEYVNDNGEFKPYEEASYKRSDYIPCYGVDYVASNISLGDATSKIFFYDGNKNFIHKESGHGIKRFRIPENAAYFVLNRGNVGDCVLTPCLDVEATWVDGVPYTITPLIEDEYVSGEKFPEYNEWSRTDYLNCVGATKIVTSNKIAYGSFYDSNKKYISNLNTFSSEDNSVEVPDFASYFIVSASNADMSNLVVTPYA